MSVVELLTHRPKRLALRKSKKFCVYHDALMRGSKHDSKGKVDDPFPIVIPVLQRRLVYLRKV